MVGLFMVDLSFYRIFCERDNLCSNIWYNFSANNSNFLQSNWFNHYAYFTLVCHTLLIERNMRHWNDKTMCGNCVNPTTQIKLAHHKKRCSVGLLNCSKRPNFSKKSRNDLNHHIAKKHSAPKPVVMSKSKLSNQGIPALHVSRQQKIFHKAFLSRQQMVIRTISSTKLMMRVLKNSCTHVDISS